MALESVTIDSLNSAVEFFVDMTRRHPERDGLAAYEAAAAGRRRHHPAFYLGHLYSPDDTLPPPDDLELPRVTAPSTPEAGLADEIIGMLTPLKMLNPVTPCFGLGSSTGTLVASFGIPLNPEAGNSPSFTKPLAEVLAAAAPDPETSGLIPAMRERIDLIRSCTPPAFRIGLPDMQGPFNLAHAILGNEALLAPYDEEERFHAFMERLTSFWIAVRRNLCAWIGAERLNPPDRVARITECSINLVSPDFYKRFVLPHDRRIAEAFGPLHIHPCSGPHVFHATLDNLPVVSTEAGYIAKTAAGAIEVDEALAAIRDRPILLFVGQELPEGREAEFIRRDLDRYAGHPRLLFSYTGMHWRRKDRPMIRSIHRELDAYWARKHGLTSPP